MVESMVHLNQYPTIHSREMIVRHADSEISLYLTDAPGRDAIGEQKYLLLLIEEMQQVVLKDLQVVVYGIIEHVRALKQKFELTDIEYLQILMRCMQTTLKYALREERHCDATKPAGLA